MQFLARDFTVQPNFFREVRFKRNFSVNVQLRDTDVSQIHLQVARQKKLLLEEPKRYDLGHRISEGVTLNNL